LREVSQDNQNMELINTISIVAFVISLHIILILFWQKLRIVAKILLLMVIVAYWMNVLTTLGEWRIGKKVLDTNTENHIRYRMLQDGGSKLNIVRFDN
jgi:glucan phosphoethanolaminetransferase (alkaline phosphatase superfamily)